MEERLDFYPASWIWLSCGRTLPNTELIFKKSFRLERLPEKACGWILADSRYVLYVNRKRVQWGPCPADPRRPEADPFDIRSFLVTGENLIEVNVLWFGRGEGTYVVSNPGMIFRLEIYSGTEATLVKSDESWLVCVNRTLAPGQHEQWFLRALQEKRDLRREEQIWSQARKLNCPSAKPLICACAGSGLPSVSSNAEDVFIRRRMIPLMREEFCEFKFSDGGFVHWKRPVDDAFDFRIPESFELECASFDFKAGSFELAAQKENEGVFFTFKLEEEACGWPELEIEAPGGTVVEFMYQESHDETRPCWLETAHHDWTRFICAEGVNVLKPFDYFCLRWFQIHVHGNRNFVRIKMPRFRRRTYEFANQAEIRSGDGELQRLFDADINTLRNSIQEGNYDGSGRERQQYSGDVGHQQRAATMLFGEYRHGARYLRTYSDGLTLEGYFLDCWPGSDRLTRLGQRQLGATQWGPILDHGVQFVFDAYNHYMESGNSADLEPLIDKLIRFGYYLSSRRLENGLIPAEHELQMSTSVWMDHSPSYGWIDQKHKTCPFNLYIAAMLKSALAPLCRELGRLDDSERFAGIAEEFYAAVKKRFWSAELNTFVDNLPWADSEGFAWLSDRTISTAILFAYSDRTDLRFILHGGLQGDKSGKADGRSALIPESMHKFKMPVRIGYSYPPNAVWRFRALMNCGKSGKVLELLKEWAQQVSVRVNNTLSECWDPLPDAAWEWSHCPVAPLDSLYYGLAGIHPLSAGFREMMIAPNCEGWEDISFSIFIPQGKISFDLKNYEAKKRIRYSLPEGCCWTLKLLVGAKLINGTEDSAHHLLIEF